MKYVHINQFSIFLQTKVIYFEEFELPYRKIEFPTSKQVWVIGNSTSVRILVNSDASIEIISFLNYVRLFLYILYVLG